MHKNVVYSNTKVFILCYIMHNSVCLYVVQANARSIPYIDPVAGSMQRPPQTNVSTIFSVLHLPYTDNTYPVVLYTFHSQCCFYCNR